MTSATLFPIPVPLVFLKEECLPQALNRSVTLRPGGELGGCAMESGDGGNWLKPKPVARCASAAFQPVEAPEHVVVLRFWYTGPIVKDIRD